MLSPDHLDAREALARRIDHTLLSPTAAPSEFDHLCDEAVRFGFWSVCVPPSSVRHVAERLAGSRVKVCTVVGFPLGYSVTVVKALEAERGVEEGASEVDMVSNFGALKSGNRGTFFEDIESVSRYCKRTGTVLKVILECCYLTDQEKVAGARLAESAGADFIKTSTGFGTGGATVADVSLLKRTLTKRVKVKAAGGIRNLEGALELIKAGADRLGTSHGAKIMEELRPA